MENQLYLMIISFALVFLLLCLIYHTKKLRRQMELLHNEKEVLNEISNEDPLTGIYNRRGFDQAAASVLARSSAAVVGLIDVNDFKRFNDVYGHAAGDVVLNATRKCYRAGCAAPEMGKCPAWCFWGKSMARIFPEFGLCLLSEACQ